jgi:hypothetical protein
VDGGANQAAMAGDVDAAVGMHEGDGHNFVLKKSRSSFLSFAAE